MTQDNEETPPHDQQRIGRHIAKRLIMAFCNLLRRPRTKPAEDEESIREHQPEPVTELVPRRPGFEEEPFEPFPEWFNELGGKKSDGAPASPPDTEDDESASEPQPVAKQESLDDLVDRFLGELQGRAAAEDGRSADLENGEGDDATEQEVAEDADGSEEAVADGPYNSDSVDEQAGDQEVGDDGQEFDTGDDSDAGAAGLGDVDSDNAAADQDWDSGEGGDAGSGDAGDAGGDE